MTFKKTISVLIAIIIMLSLCACAVPPDEENIIIKDMIGREVSIKKDSYSRVVCIGAGALRMYSYVGEISLLCGVEDIDNTTLDNRPKMFDSVARPYLIAYEEEFSLLHSCGVGGPNAQTAESEKILKCNPDIVISEYEDIEKEDALQTQLGIPVITLKSGYDGVFDKNFADSLTLLGKIFGKETRAKAINDFIAAEMSAIAERTNNIAEKDKPSVYICGLGNWGTTNHLMTAQNYSSFTVANIKNVLTDLSANGIQTIEAEKFVSVGEDIDVMIIDAAAVKNIKPLYREDNNMFNTCKAWNTGEVYLQMAYNAYYTNYETALVNTWFIAKAVYPELFNDIDITEKLNQVTKLFLGSELAEKIYAYPNNFGGYQKIDTDMFFA